MIVSHKYKFACMVAPKTGSSTMKKLLRENFEAFIWDYKEKWFGDQTHRCWLPEEIKDYFIFAICRNPFDLVCSRYNFFHPRATHAIKSGCKPEDWGIRSYYLKPFAQWIAENSIPLKYFYIKEEAPPGYAPLHPHFVKLENLEEEFNSLPFVDKKVQLPHLNKAMPKKVLNCHFNEEVINLVLQKHEIDFELFGYPKKCPMKFRTTLFM